MSSNQGSIPILGAIFISIAGVLGVQAVVKDDSLSLRSKNTLEAQQIAKETNQSATNLSRAMIAWHGSSPVGGDSTNYPAVYLKDYFQTSPGSCNGANCYPLKMSPFDHGTLTQNSDLWSISNGFIIPKTTFADFDAADSNAPTAFYADPNRSGIPGKLRNLNSKAWVSNVLRQNASFPNLVTALELSVSSRPPRYGLADLVMPDLTAKYLVKIDPPPNPVVFVDYYGGAATTASPQYLSAQDDLRIKVSARGLAREAKLTLFGYPNLPFNNCAAVQGYSGAKPQSDENYQEYAGWKNQELYKYTYQGGSSMPTAVWQCWYPKLGSTKRANIDTLEPDGPTPTLNYQTRFNVAGLNPTSVDSNNQRHVDMGGFNCNAVRNAEGYCPTDIDGPTIPIIKQPNCRMNIAVSSSVSEMNVGEIHNSMYLPFNSYVQTYGMVWPNATSNSGAKIRVTKFNEWSLSWESSSTVVANLSSKKAGEEATGVAYASRPGGRSPSFSGAIFGRWADYKSNSMYVKNWLTLYGSYQPGSAGRYLIVGEASGPGGSSDCVIEASEGDGTIGRWRHTYNIANQWAPVELRDVTWNGVNAAPVAWGGGSYADVSTQVSVSWDARGHTSCRVVRTNDNAIFCDNTGSWENSVGSFERWYSYSCNLDTTTATLQYRVECFNPLISHPVVAVHADGSASSLSPNIRRVCPAAGGPQFAAYISSNQAEINTCAGEIHSGIDAHNTPDPDDCQKCSGTGKVWCDATSLPYAYDRPWHGGTYPNRCHCNNAGIGIDPAGLVQYLANTYGYVGAGGCGW